MPESLLTQPVVPRNAGGRLFVVGTPIGNLEDITFRAIRTLKQVDLVACEDTRRTQKLLAYYSIRTTVISYYEHNELTRAPELILRMEDGSQIALVSDAGMPVISDPGYRLVKLAVRHNIPVIPVPGPSALVASLAAAGLPVDHFHFIGFLPARKVARQKALKALSSVSGTIVFFEAPHRIVETLGDLQRALGDRPTVLAREVTKVYEEFVRGSVSEVLDRLERKPIKGEVTVLVGPPADSADPLAKPTRLWPILAEMKNLMAHKGLDERTALKALAKSRGISRSEAYRQWQRERSLAGDDEA